MTDKKIRQINVVLALFCLLSTIASLVAFHLCMDKTHVISPDTYFVKANTDQSHGGKTQAVISKSQKGIELQCDFSRAYALPFCEVEFVISADGNGIDLSTYDYVTLDMDYQGQANPRFRFYVRNHDKSYSVSEDDLSNKFNRFDFSLDDTSKIELGYFNVPMWWIDYYNHPINLSAVDITNAVSVEIGLGASTLAGQHTLLIRNVTFHGKSISHLNLTRTLIGIWIVFAVYYICISVYLFKRAALTAVKKQQKMRTEIQDLKLKATTDPLTGARNRTEALDRFYDFERLSKQGNLLHIALFDLDNFKQVNDIHGHDIGDDVLIQFVEAASTVFDEQYLMYRWGGEEFLLICLESNTLQCHRVITTFTDLMKKWQWPHELKVTTSIGYTSLKNNESIRTAIKRADEALYNAKANGRDQMVIRD